jgi:uncharacterized protein YeaO (DUF488 family)
MAQYAHIRIVRVYDHDASVPDDAYRVLVDRLWPRGVAKVDLDFDVWPKDVTPSGELRTWYGHDRGRWDEFARRYRDELAEDPARGVLAGLIDEAARRPVVLLTAVKDVGHSAAQVLLEQISAAVDDR